MMTKLLADKRSTVAGPAANVAIGDNKTANPVTTPIVRCFILYGRPRIGRITNGTYKTILFLHGTLIVIALAVLAICKALDCQPGDVLEYRK